MSPEGIWAKVFPDRGNKQCKGPVAEEYPAHTVFTIPTSLSFSVLHILLKVGSIYSGLTST